MLPAPEGAAAELWVLYATPDNRNFVWWPVEIVGSTDACLSRLGSGVAERRSRQGRMVGERDEGW